MAARGGARVTVVDSAKRLGAKILISGGGRCNVTNRAVTAADFWGGSRSTIARVLNAWTVDDTVGFFADAGVPLHEEARGKLFPDANAARVVLDALLTQAAAVGVHIETGWRVDQVIDDGEQFAVVGERGRLTSQRLVLTTGGRSVPKTGSTGAGYGFARDLGHHLVEPIPALVPLLLQDGLHQHVAGVTVDVEIAVVVDGRVAVRTRGPLLWTHVGVSGPAALDASRHWHRAQIDGHRVAITVNFRPGARFDDVEADWTRQAAEHPRASVQTSLATMMPASAAAALLHRLGIDGSEALAHFSRDARRRLSRALVEWPLPVTGSRGYNFAEATAGGVALTEIDPSTMGSRICSGLYLVGEMLDVDGRIGGFNFQWAWSTGYVAGRGIAAAI